MSVDGARRRAMFAVLERMEQMEEDVEDDDAEDAERKAEQLALLRAYSRFLTLTLNDLLTRKSLNRNLDALNTFENALNEERVRVSVWIARLLPEPDTSTDEEEDVLRF